MASKARKCGHMTDQTKRSELDMKYESGNNEKTKSGRVMIKVCDLDDPVFGMLKTCITILMISNEKYLHKKSTHMKM